MGLNTTEILVLSQVILSFGIALALIPLLMLTGDRTLMGEHRNHPLTQAIGRAHRRAGDRPQRLSAGHHDLVFTPPSSSRLVNRG